MLGRPSEATLDFGAHAGEPSGISKRDVVGLRTSPYFLVAEEGPEKADVDRPRKGLGLVREACAITTLSCTL